MKPYVKTTASAYDQIVSTYIEENESDGTDFLKPILEKLMKVMACESLDDIKVLELGYGTGRDVNMFLKFGMRKENYLGLDISEGMSKLCLERFPGIRFEVADISTCSYPSSEFDMFWSAASLLHLTQEDIITTLTNVRNSLKSGGVGMVSMRVKQGRDDKGPGLVEDVKGGKKVKRYFSYFEPAEFRRIVEKSGFSVVDLETMFEPDGKTEWMFLYVRK